MGTSCSDLHATVQAWHPIHLRLSTMNPKFIDVLFPARVRGASWRLRQAQEREAEPTIEHAREERCTLPTAHRRRRRRRSGELEQAEHYRGEDALQLQSP